MNCPKCKGFMERVECRDGIKKELQWRCVNCGTYVPVKIENPKCFVCGYEKCKCKGKVWNSHIPKGKGKGE